MPIPLSAPVRRRPPLGRWQRFWLIVGVSTLAGVVAAGVALPFVGGAGLAAKSSADAFMALPSDLETPPLPQRSRILAADGSVLATFYYENRVAVPLAEVAPVMQTAIVDIEDDRFYEHSGFDLKGALRALVTNGQAGQVRQGGSTLTQQYVKNVLIESAQTKQGRQAASKQTLARKVRELRYATALEERDSKQQILEGYLNIAYFGSGAYGVEAASRHFFGHPASQLTLPQAALLAGLVRNPNGYDPIAHAKAAKERRDTVLDRMAQLGSITQAQAEEAKASPLGLNVQQTDNGCAGSGAPFFCDYVLQRFLHDDNIAPTLAARRALLLRGGLTIQSTMDPTVQAAAQQAVDSTVPRTSRFGTAIAMVQPGTGKVLALAVNRDYGSAPDQTTVNYATDKAYGGSSGFPAGSTFKVFTLIAALEDGLPLSLRINSPQTVTVPGFTDCRTGKPLPAYQVSNAGDSEAGNFTMAQATVESVNTYYVQLERRIGLCDPVRVAGQLGVADADGSPLPTNHPSFTLGTDSVSPLTMAEAYATLAAHGNHCDPVAIISVTGADGKRLDIPPPTCEQVVDPKIADTVTSVLTGVIADPKGTAHGVQGIVGRPAAGKTGTVENYAAAWFAGYTPQIAAAVWLGDPRGGFKYPLDHVTIGGQFYPQVYGATVPAPIWAKAMAGALAGQPVVPFAAADAGVANGTPVVIPDVQGLTVGQATQQLQAHKLTVTVSPTQVPSGVPAGQVAGTDPPAGTGVLALSTVTLLVSNGQPPPPPPEPVPTFSPSPTAEPTPYPTIPPPGGGAPTCTGPPGKCKNP